MGWKTSGSVTIYNTGGNTAKLISHPRANRVSFMGDSNTEMTLYGSTGGTSFQAGQQVSAVGEIWPAIGCMLSGQRMFHGVNVAISGAQSRDVLNVQVPKILADNPAKCVIMVGTNDVAGGTGGLPVITPAETKANIAAIANQLVAAGIEPIFCTIYPRNQNSTITPPPNIHGLTLQFNTWLKQFCHANGYHCLDFYSLLVQPATGNINAWSADGEHAGVYLNHYMGEFMAENLAPFFPLWTPYITQSNDDPTNLLTLQTGSQSNPILVNGGLFLNSTTTPGVPDGWSTYGSGVTYSLTNQGPVFGNFATITAQNPVSGPAGLSYTIPKVNPVTGTNNFNDNDLISVCGKVMAKVPYSAPFTPNLTNPGFINDGTAGSYTVYVTFDQGTVTPNATNVLKPVNNFRASFETPGTFYVEGHVPAGTTSITAWIEWTSGAGQVSVGQFTIQNLTSLGVGGLHYAN